VYKFLAHPAAKIQAFLESERQRHIQQGTKPGINVANAYTEVHKLSLIQGCPTLTEADVAHMKAVVARAEDDSMQIERNADPRQKQTELCLLTQTPTIS